VILLKSAKEIALIRASCRVAAEAMAVVMEQIRPGVSTACLDDTAERYIRRQGGEASAKGYHGYPRSICVSVNDEVVHGIPGDRMLREGDLLAVDIAVKKEGYHGDMNVTFAVGAVDDEGRRLMAATQEAMERGIAAAVAGNRLGDIGWAIQSFVEDQGYSIVREYCGHGLGRGFHEDPQVLHFGTPGTGRRLQHGMVFTVEPMVNQGGPDVVLQDDGWTAVTADGRLSAQFEHTIAVSPEGPAVLSRFADLPF
jgi:methionyl aminopeptidase